MAEDTRNRVVRIAQGLFLLNMVIWLVIGLFSLVWLDSGADSTALLVVALMVLGNAVLMGLAAWWLGKRTIWGYLFALVLLVINMIATFTDQVGLLDYATVLVDIVLFLLLILKQNELVRQPEG